MCGCTPSQMPLHGTCRTEDLHFGLGLAGASIVGLDQAHIVRIEQDIQNHNNSFAERNRIWFADHRILTLNLMSSPGSGKTTLLVRTIRDIKEHFPIAVIEGDQQTTLDAERIRSVGAPAVQVNTGRGCHLDAHMIEHALPRLALPDDGVLFIENVGNLICPAGFDLGESRRVVIVSVTEGEDKPLKYPDIFAAAELLVITKADLLPLVRFDVDKCLDFALRINPALTTITVSAETGTGLEEWYAWIARSRAVIMAGTGVDGLHVQRGR